MLLRLVDKATGDRVGKFSLIDLAGAERGADHETSNKKTQVGTLISFFSTMACSVPYIFFSHSDFKTVRLPLILRYFTMLFLFLPLISNSPPSLVGRRPRHQPKFAGVERSDSRQRARAKPRAVPAEPFDPSPGRVLDRHPVPNDGDWLRVPLYRRPELHHQHAALRRVPAPPQKGRQVEGRNRSQRRSKDPGGGGESG